MRIELIIDTMLKIPTGVFVLILFMSFAASLLVHQILKTEFYTTLACIPALLGAGILANTLLALNGVALSADKASNVALSTSMGFIVAAFVVISAMRVWSRIQDKR